MGGLDFLWRDVVVVPAAGVVAVAVVAWAGCLRRSALSQAPQRDVGLGAADLVVALAMMWLGMWVAQDVLGRMGVPGHVEPLADDYGVVGPTRTPLELMQQAWIGQVLVHLPVVLYVLWRVGGCHQGVARFGLGLTSPVRHSVAGLLGLAVALPVALGLSVVVAVIGEKVLGQPPPLVGHEMLSAFGQSTRWPVALGLFASAVVGAPVFEELVFRGLAQTALLSVVGRARRWSVVVLGSVVFALMHLGQPWQVLPSLFVLGVVLGWLYERTGSLLPGILVHAGFNAVNVALTMMM